MKSNNALILLQENGGVIPFDQSLPVALRQQLSTLVDRFAERMEDLKTRLQGGSKYAVIHLLTDNACTREGLLNALLAETRKGRQIDVFVLGHGGPEELILNRPPNLTGGTEGTIRSLKAEAKAAGVKKLNLRLVYMCNCYGATLNDDWLAVGASVSVGSRERDMMPEPMTTFFMHHWLAGIKVKEAATRAYESTIPFFLPFYPPTPKITYRTVEVTYPTPTLTNPLRLSKEKIQIPDGVELIRHANIVETELVVDGDANLTF